MMRRDFDETVAEDFPTARAMDLVVSTYDEFTRDRLIPHVDALRPRKLCSGGSQLHTTAK